MEAKVFLEEENPYAYFHFLKYTKGNLPRFDYDLHVTNTIQCRERVEFITFRKFICELIYNAINFFPEICEYTITCKNESGISTLCFAVFEEMSDDDHFCLGKFVSTDIDMYLLNLNEIKQLYMNNRNKDTDPFIVETLLMLMCMGGSIPTVTTSFKINEKEFKGNFKTKESFFIREEEPVIKEIKPRHRSQIIKVK
jgi:hypothetical protein